MSIPAEDGASCETGGKGTMPKVGHRLHGSAWARGKQVRDCHRARARRSADFGGLDGGAMGTAALPGAPQAWLGVIFSIS